MARRPRYHKDWAKVPEQILRGRGPDTTPTSPPTTGPIFRSNGMWTARANRVQPRKARRR